MHRRSIVSASLTLLVAAGLALPSTASAGAYSTLTKVSGDGQHVALGTTYAPLKVRATDAGAAPVAGVQVTYTIFPDGATGAGAAFPGGATSSVVSSDANGLATAPTLTANSHAGFFEVDATTPDPTFQMVTFLLTNVTDTTPPTVTLSKPAAVTLSRSIPVAWSATDPNGSGVASYDVRYRKAAWNGLFGAYATLRSSTTTRSLTFTGAYGYDYCFQVRARDVAGNLSGWTTRCSAIPLDDRSLVASSRWRLLTGSAYFHSTIAQSATIGSTLTRTGVRKGRVALVATRAPGYGTVSVLYNGRLVKKVSLAWPTTQRKHVFTLPNFTATTGKIVIKVITAKRVQIDGLVAARI